MKGLNKCLGRMIAFASAIFISGMFIASAFNTYSAVLIEKPKIEMVTTNQSKDTTKQCIKHFKESQARAYQVVDEHIKSIAPKSKVSGKVIVENCIKYDIDIKLVLAQAQQESHFGTMGVAKKTNSIFNVLAYDGRSAKNMIQSGHAFKHPDESVEPFMQLLKRRYLVNGKTEKQLLQNYVDKNGKRYATAKNYEYKLKGIYNQIPNEIYNSINQYKLYKNIVYEYIS